MSTINVSIVGDHKVGKTSFINRLKTGRFSQDYVPTIEAKSTLLNFSTSQGEIKLNVIENCFEPVDAAIIMFDVTSHSSYSIVEQLYRKLTLINSNIPIVLCGNKLDLTSEGGNPFKYIKFHLENNLQYYHLSSKTNFNYEKPLLYIMRKVTGDANLVYTEQ